MRLQNSHGLVVWGSGANTSDAKCDLAISRFLCTNRTGLEEAGKEAGEPQPELVETTVTESTAPP